MVRIIHSNVTLQRKYFYASLLNNPAALLASHTASPGTRFSKGFNGMRLHSQP